ncbi:MAG: XRE family transcriptional regulator, partial [Proteobacteria bacterium]|nr:XRE family transcriptional regulator [Pseudomonadota bacterium]
DRIKTYRKRLNLTQKDLAVQMGFNSPETLSQIERGDRELKAWELVQLARLLSVNLNDLLRIEYFQEKPVVLWRESPETEKEIKESMFIKRCEDYAILEELCGSRTAGQFPQKKVASDDVSYEMARRLASEVRREFNLGDRPARELIKILEEGFGVKIWYFEMEEGSAASTIGPFGPAILMNLNEAPWRRNYNFAHEIFHLITWDSFPPSLIEKEPALWDKLEKIANVFASCILLPGDDVRIEFEKNIDKDSIAYIDLIEIARKFDVSTEALLFRLLNLKLLDKTTVDNILKDQLFREIDKSTMAPRWWRPPKFPERFVRLAFVAYKKGRLSKAKLAEMLDTSLIDLPKTLQEYGHKDREGYDAEVRVA